jgi:2'-5' RNA ligase
MPEPAEQKRRLFFALWPDDAVRAQIAAASRAVCKRPVSEANLHLTLCFLGMQDEQARQCFCDAAGQVQGAPFTLLLDRYGGWVRKRIQWLGASAAPVALGELVNALNEALAACGIEAEKRPFVPHLTLSRKATNPRTGPVPEVIHWPVNDFVLVESVPTPDGVRYVVLERWAL